MHDGARVRVRSRVVDRAGVANVRRLRDCACVMADGNAEHRIAIAVAVGRADCTRHSVAGDDRHSLSLACGQRCVRGHHADGRVLTGQQRRQRRAAGAAADGGPNVPELVAVLEPQRVQRAGPVDSVEDASAGIDDDGGPNHDASGKDGAGRPEAARQTSCAGSGSASDTALRNRAGARTAGSDVTVMADVGNGGR